MLPLFRRRGAQRRAWLIGRKRAALRNRYHMDVFLTVSLPFLHFHHTPPCYIHVGGTYSEGSEYFKQRSIYCQHTDEASGAQTASAGVEQAPRGHLTRRAAGSGERRQRRYRKEWFLMRPGKFMAWP